MTSYVGFVFSLVALALGLIFMFTGRLEWRIYGLGVVILNIVVILHFNAHVI